MKRQSTGRGTDVLHKDFTQSLRVIVDSTHTVPCAIRHGGSVAGSSFNPATGSKTLIPNPPHFVGACSVSPADQGSNLTAESEVIPSYDYVLGLSYDDAPALTHGDIVTIMGQGLHGAPDLSGQLLKVEFLDRDGVTAERLVMCVEYQP